MKTRDGLLLFVLGLIVSVTAAFFQPVPGYMDAEYYYSGGVMIASGSGFYEPFLWNYLDDPAGLPHPSHTYWMPLTSLVAAAGMALAGSRSFMAGRAGFILLAACLPVITAWLAGKITAGKPIQRFAVWMAGGVAVFPGFYLIYTTLTETFVLYMLLGSLLVAVSFEEFTPWLGKEAGWRCSLLMGLLAGLLHLTRADGILWLAGILLLDGAHGVVKMRQNGRWSWGGYLSLVWILLGYGTVMGAWYLRNLDIYGQWMAPGGSRTLWLTNYDQTYNYPADSITFQAWLSSGWSAILQVRLEALWLNIKNMLVVQSSIFLLPLIILGWWQVRKQTWARFTFGMWLLTLLIMTFVFPFAGSRGGYLHSGAAFQPIWWALTPLGLARLIDLAAQARNWNRAQARSVLGTGLVMLCALFTVGIFVTRVLGLGADSQPWRASWDAAVAIDDALVERGIPEEIVVLVNNPPGFYAATGRPAIAIPNGDVETVRTVAARYDARYLIVEENSVTALRGLFDAPKDMDGLIYLGPVGKGYLFEVQP